MMNTTLQQKLIKIFNLYSKNNIKHDTMKKIGHVTFDNIEYSLYERGTNLDNFANNIINNNIRNYIIIEGDTNNAYIYTEGDDYIWKDFNNADTYRNLYYQIISNNNRRNRRISMKRFNSIFYRFIFLILTYIVILHFTVFIYYLCNSSNVIQSSETVITDTYLCRIDDNNDKICYL